MKSFITAALVATASAVPAFAGTMTLSGNALTSAQNDSAAFIPTGSLVLFLVDTALNDGFSGLGSSVSLSLGGTLAVGELFGSYDIIAYSQSTTAAGFIQGNNLSLAFGSGQTAQVGDQFGIVWFDGADLPYEVDTITDITSALNGLSFGFATHSTWTFPSTDTNLTKTFVSSPTQGSQTQAQSITSVQGATRTISAVPEPSAFGLAGAAVALAWVLRKR